jgi:hypothetical protein
MAPLSGFHLLALCLTLEEPIQRAREAQRQAAEDVRVLKAARVPTDGPGLVRFLRRGSAAPDEKHIQALLRALGDRSFKVRERAAADLSAEGPAVLPLLLQGMKGADLETRRRLQGCIAAIEQAGSDPALAAAARRLVALRPEGACAALLSRLPLAGEEGEEVMVSALMALGARGGQLDPNLVKALADPTPACRGAAALALGWGGAEGQREAVRRLLRTDPDRNVRLRAAQGLLLAGDPTSIPTLLTILGKGSADQALRAEELLLMAAGKTAPAVVLGIDGGDRGKCQGAWRAWWKGQQHALRLVRRPLPAPPADAAHRARKGCDHFLQALVRGDMTKAREVTAVPFYVVPDAKVCKNRQELDDLIKRNGKMPDRSIKLSIGRIVPLQEHAKTLDQEQKELLTGLRLSAVQVVFVTAQLDGKGGTIPFLVWTRGRPRVIGVGKPEDDR